MKFFLASIFMILSINLMSQGLASFRWEHRLVLLITPDENENLLQRQIDILSEDKAGLKERKLQIIHIKPAEARLLLPEPGKLSLKKSDFERFKPGESPFSFILIGLDGGVKLRRNEVVSREYLYARIDGMPMRRAEMRSKKNKPQP
ncbi:MAG: DUF4174 domain-containing protein [Bacteroidota bacterium]